MRQTPAKAETALHSFMGVMTESSPNRTLSQNQNTISVLRKRTFTQQFVPGLKKLAFFVAQLSCQIEMNGNRYLQRPLTYSLGKILS
jgi:hypothetical protein